MLVIVGVMKENVVIVVRVRDLMDIRVFGVGYWFERKIVY